MAKIEEITAILIDEIQSFEKAIAVLKEESEKIKTTKVTINTSLIDKKYNKILHVIGTTYIKQNEQVKFLQSKLNKSVIFPKWAIILFSSFFMIFLSSMYLNFYQYKNAITKAEMAYSKGKEDFNNYITLFFKDHPESLKKYKAWNKK